MSISELPSEAETLPFLAEIPPVIAADELSVTPDFLSERAAYEPMPPVPEDELEAAMHSRSDGVLSNFAKVWRKMFPERPFDPDRRRLIGGMAAIGFTASQFGQAMYVNNKLRHVDAALAGRWPEDKPRLSFLGEVPKSPKKIAMFYPGFGDPDSQIEAEDFKLHGHIDPDTPIAYMTYSNNGPEDTEKLVDAVYETVPDMDEVKGITSVGRSLGGPISLAVEARIGRPVDFKMVIASPLLQGDAFMAPTGAALAKLPDSRLVDADIKYGISLWSDLTHRSAEYPETPMDDLSKAVMDIFHRHGGHDNFHEALNKTLAAIDTFGADTAQAWGAVWYGVDPLALQRELRVWANEHLSTDPRKLDPAFLAGIRKAYIPGRTKFYYTATDHPSTDTTVRVIAGAYNWRKFMLEVAKLPPEDVHIIGLPYDGHAQVEATVKYMAPVIEDNTYPPQDPNTAIMAAGAPNNTTSP